LINEMSFHPTDGGAVIYDAAAKRLFALNTPAAFVWLAVRDGGTRETIRSELASTLDLAEGQAESWIELALASFGQAMLENGSRPALAQDQAASPSASTLLSGTDYMLLGQTVRISAPDTALELIDSMIGQFRRTRSDRGFDRPDISISIAAVGRKFAVSSTDDPTAVTEPEKLVAEVERRIVQDLIPRVPHFLAFHAALLHVRGQALLFPAPSGSGKTTLSAALAGEGWSYMTDEMALLDRNLTWQGLPFPPCVKAKNFPLIESLHPGLRDIVEHDRFGYRVKFLPLPAQSGRVAVSTVVFPEYGAEAEGSLRPLRPLEGLQRLLMQCEYVPPGFSTADVPNLLEWHGNAEYYALAFCSPQEAVQLLHNAHKSLGKPLATI
jgi:hypothetical protein